MINIFQKEELTKRDKPKVGLVLCGFNFLTEPYDKWPREEIEYIQFVEVVEYIINKIGATVHLMSHSNGFELPPNFKLIPGRDFPIAKQLYEIIVKRENVNKDDIKLIKGPYTPQETKAIIRQFDMFLTGRLHASVAAISQSVPTVVLMHGHKQKSHKTIGFFDIAGLPEYVAYPHNSNDIIKKVQSCWENRERIKLHLDKRMPEVKQLAKESFNVLTNIAGINSNEQ